MSLPVTVHSSPIQRAVMLIVVSLKGGISGDTMVLIVMVLTLSYLVDTIVLIVVVVTLMALILVVLTLVLVSHQWWPQWSGVLTPLYEVSEKAWHYGIDGGGVTINVGDCNGITLKESWLLSTWHQKKLGLDEQHWDGRGKLPIYSCCWTASTGIKHHHIRISLLDKPARLIVRLLFGFVSDSETSVATPWERLQNLWRASAQWKLVATHVFWWISPPTYVKWVLDVFLMHPLHFSVAEKDFSSSFTLLYSPFNCLKFGKTLLLVCTKGSVSGSTPIGWQKTNQPIGTFSRIWGTERDAQFWGLGDWYQQMALISVVWVAKSKI